MTATLMMLLTSLSLLVSTLSSVAKADTIKFPEEELATESVLPVFDTPTSVKNRTVSTAKRIELGLLGGLTLNEPYASPYNFGGEASYHLDEDQAINLYGAYFMGGDSKYVSQINQQAQAGSNQLNLQYAPHPKWLILGSYQLTAFYGKLSITKNFIMNLSTYVHAGLGGFEIGDAINPAVAVGFGQKFHFTPNLALRFDLRLLIYQGPDPLSNPSATATATSEVSSSKFSKRMYMNSLLSLGAIYLIPNS